MAARRKIGDAAGDPSDGSESVRKGSRKPAATGHPNTWTRGDVVFVAVVLGLLMLVTIPEMEGGVLLPPRNPLAEVVVASGGWVGLVAAAWFVHRSSWFRFRRDMIARHGKRARDPMFPVLVAVVMAAGFGAGWYATHRMGPQWVTRLGGDDRTRPALLLALPEHPIRRNCKRPAVVRFPDRPEPFETCFLPEAVRADARAGDTLVLAVREGGLGIQVEGVLALRKPSP